MPILAISLEQLEFARSYNFAVLILVTYEVDAAVIRARCYRSMKKSEPSHNLEARINLVDCSTSGRCLCVAGVEGYCHHVDFFALICTRMPQKWSIPREKKVEPKEIHNILVNKPKGSANYNLYTNLSRAPFTLHQMFTVQ